MTVDEFHHAVRRGLGSAILHLQRNDPRPHYESIVHVCVHNTCYDTQCDSSRAEYVLRLMNLTPEPDRFRDLIRNAWLDTRVRRDALHLVELVRLLAEQGDTGSRAALYARFETVELDDSCLGAFDIVELDGIDGLLRASRRIGRELAAGAQPDPDRWICPMLLSETVEKAGRDATLAALTEVSKSDPAVRAFAEVAIPEFDLRENRPVSRPTSTVISYDALLDQWELENKPPSRGQLSSWGVRATESDIQRAASDLLAVQERDRLLAYLVIFQRRAFPLEPHRILELTGASDENISHAAFVALRHVTHEAVRQYAVHELSAKRISYGIVGLLQSNYQEGDHALIEAALPNEGSDDDLHGIGMALDSAFEVNPTDSCLGSLIWCYRQTPCALCRGSAVDLLISRKLLPDWMREECMHDSDEQIRQLARDSESQK